MKYKIHIGKVYDVDEKKRRPKQTLFITEEQFEIIKDFADTRKNEDLQTTYIINKCEFKVEPHFDVKDLIK